MCASVENGTAAKTEVSRLAAFFCISQAEIQARVAELGSLSSGAKMAMTIFVKRAFTIVGTNALFLRVIANLQI